MCECGQCVGGGIDRYGETLPLTFRPLRFNAILTTADWSHPHLSDRRGNSCTSMRASATRTTSATFTCMTLPPTPSARFATIPPSMYEAFRLPLGCIHTPGVSTQRLMVVSAICTARPRFGRGRYYYGWASFVLCEHVDVSHTVTNSPAHQLTHRPQEVPSTLKWTHARTHALTAPPCPLTCECSTHTLMYPPSRDRAGRTPCSRSGRQWTRRAVRSSCCRAWRRGTADRTGVRTS